jgi:hypothetical protein
MIVSRRGLAFALAAGAAILVGALVYRAYLVHELRKPVLAKLTDPDSALFQNERFIGPWMPSDGVLCGEVNAKNRMGGYVGYSRFVSTPRLASVDTDGNRFTSANCDPSKMPAVPWWWLRW